VTINGSLSANSPKATSNNWGGGSGGSIWVVASSLAGSGVISANGSSNTNAGYGGGGRVDISQTANSFVGAI
jgi:hypothetical protein